MRLADLARIPGIGSEAAPARLAGGGAVTVTGVSHDSRAVKPGDLFVCLVGEKFDGHRFAADALARGATALCIEEGRSVPASASAVVVPDTRRALPALAAAVYGDPSRDLTLVGVTGTNGKTTTTLMVAAILRAAGRCAGTVGTLGAELMAEPMDSERTTPEADQLQALLAEMRRRGADAVAMEVSSHALAQFRTDGCRFDAAVFTNLTQDHLDYHGTLDSYFQTKLRLFREYPAAGGKDFVAAVNLDDPRGAEVARQTRGRVVTYAVHRAADVTARDLKIDASRVEFTAISPVAEFAVGLGIGGAFQASNALGAIACGIGLGIEPQTISRGLSELKAVPGRFEPVETGRGFAVVVDYAHTPDGLRNLIDSARRLNPGRLLVVFGCGGDRDRAKRPIMGGIAAAGADLAIVTSDNPRSEDPDEIIAEIKEGMAGASRRIVVEADRRQAIGLALAQARPGDLVLIAGKGHEDYQEIRGVKHPFDDRKVVREWLAAQ